jgi:hypothetical protein
LLIPSPFDKPWIDQSNFSVHSILLTIQAANPPSRSAAAPQENLFAHKNLYPSVIYHYKQDILILRLSFRKQDKAAIAPPSNEWQRPRKDVESPTAQRLRAGQPRPHSPDLWALRHRLKLLEPIQRKKALVLHPGRFVWFILQP